MKYIKLFLLAAMLLPFVGIKAADVVTTEGAWCWFADPRALHYENESGTINASYLGYIDVHGNIKATQVDFVHNRRSEVLIRSYFQPDDHNNPTFLVLPDERIMIFYTRHTDEAKIWYRISQKPGDITWLGEEKYIAVANNTTYPSPFILSDDPEHIYVCWRGINWHPTIARITMPDENDNVTIDFGPKQIVQSTGARPYAKYQSNGKDKIYLSYTTGHPDNEQPNWLYFNVIDINHGNGPILKDIKGTTLKTISSGVFNVSKTDSYANSYPYTIVDKSANIRNWVWQITLDNSENPVIAYTHIDDAKTSHVYWYSRWNGTNWKNTWVQYAGHAFHQNWNSTERCYSGGATIDPDNINHLYLSIPTTNGTYNRDGVYEIWRFTINDAGSVTGSEQITHNSTKNNVRPFILPGSANSPLRLGWMNGDYYYWMVNKNYPKGYPTALMCDYTLPRENVNLSEGEGATAGNTAFTIMDIVSPDADNYQGIMFTAGSLTLGLNAESKLYVTVDGTTYTSSNAFLTSDAWATNSTGTEGKSFPSKITKAVLTLTYDGSVLTLYRNGLIEMKLDIEGLTFADVEEGSVSGETATWSRALNQDEVAALRSRLIKSMISVPEEVYTDIVLPTTVDGTSVTWTSSNTAVISNGGLVTLPSEPKKVTLTAKVGDETLTFNVTVMPRDITKTLLLQYLFEEDDVFSQSGASYVRDNSGNDNHMRVMGSAVIDGTLNLSNNTLTAFSTNGYGLAPAGLLSRARSYTFIFDASIANRGKLPRFYDFGSGGSNSVFLRLTSSFHYSAGSKYNGGTTLMVESSESMPLNEKQRLAVTFDAKTKRTTIYVNGEQVATGTNVTYEPYQLVSGNNDTRNYIGRTQWWDTNSDNGDVVGYIDNFSFFNIALTQEEVRQYEAVANGVSSLPTVKGKTEERIYNLAGQRIASPQRGIYIVNGKKIVK